MGLCDEGPVMVVYPVCGTGVCNRLMYPKSSVRICAMASPSIASHGTMRPR